MPKEQIISSSALRRVKGIHKLSLEYNGKVAKPHQERLLELMRHHIDEIEELAAQKNKHFLVETGDLAVLCLELILENEKSVDEILECCFGRYERKLNCLLQECRKVRKTRL